jgi:hypothetical protein
VAVSSDGVSWVRGAARIEGARGPQRSLDVGKVLEPNGDWWWFDTCHLSVADVQILSSSSVSSGTGVYWMFYSGGTYEPVALPAGMSQVGAMGWAGARLRRPCEGPAAWLGTQYSGRLAEGADSWGLAGCPQSLL